MRSVCFLSEAKHPPPVVTFGKGNILRYEEHILFLGVTFDRQFTFSAHINHVHAKGWRNLNLVRRLVGNYWGAGLTPCRLLYTRFVRLVLTAYLCGMEPNLPTNKIRSRESLTLSSPVLFALHFFDATHLACLKLLANRREAFVMIHVANMERLPPTGILSQLFRKWTTSTYSSSEVSDEELDVHRVCMPHIDGNAIRAPERQVAQNRTCPPPPELQHSE